MVNLGLRPMEFQYGDHTPYFLYAALDPYTNAGGPGLFGVRSESGSSIRKPYRAAPNEHLPHRRGGSASPRLRKPPISLPGGPGYFISAVI
ncbi:hypothetical protein NDU88_010778 [Pleurodeles waltl]|uniref:Uncharacterized protein n=1 Tax=Pleurodeles waltl TaxID=8319 RepID=A0AAV7QWV3_PLEWA|nr:hypothetical protein NDU88_010778 [Pleurodeles waltl]